MRRMCQCREPAAVEHVSDRVRQDPTRRGAGVYHWGEAPSAFLGEGHWLDIRCGNRYAAIIVPVISRHMPESVHLFHAVFV